MIDNIINELNAKYKYFFKYLSLESGIDNHNVENLFADKDIIYWGDERYKSINNWVVFTQILKYGMLYFSSYHNLNDPFEFIINVDFTNSTDKDLLKEYHTRFLRDKVSLQKYEENIRTAEKQRVKRGYAPHLIKGDFPPFGIYSLSEDPVNIQMWSYYANKHNGCCIAFEINWKMIVEYLAKHSIDSSYISRMGKEFPIYFTLTCVPEWQFALSKVAYSEIVPNYPFDKFCLAHINDEFFFKHELCDLLTGNKHKDWEHEAEWRLICFNQYSNSEKQLVPVEELKFIKPKGIILGYKMEDGLKKIINQTFKEKYNIIELKPKIYDRTIYYAFCHSTQDIYEKFDTKDDD